MVKNKIRRKKRGQSTLEYLILVAGIIALLIIFLGPNGLFITTFNGILEDSASGMNTMSNRLGASRPLSP